MVKKLLILLIFSILELLNALIFSLHVHNLYAIFAKFLEICKQFSKTLVNEKGNQSRPGAAPRFSDLEVIALSMTAESIGIDSENYLFAKLSLEYPYRLNQKDWKPAFIPFAKARKRIETVFSQMCGKPPIQRTVLCGGLPTFALNSKILEYGDKRIF